MVSFRSVDAIGSLWKEQGKQNIWFVGSYALYGMPLLETAVSSSIAVAQRLGVKCPWTGVTTPPSATTNSLDALEGQLKVPPRRHRAALNWLPALLLALLLVALYRRW